MLEIVLRDNKIPLYVGEDNKKTIIQPRCDAFCITPEGNMEPCCIFPIALGNLKNEAIVDILRNSKELKWWNNLTLDDYEQCGKQEHCNFCNFCPGVNFSETGNPLKQATTNCEIAKIRCGLAEKLKQGNDPLDGKTVQECLSSISVPLLDLKQEYGQNYRNKKLTAGG